MMRGTVIGLLLAAGAAGAANATPFEAVDATADFMMMIDQASLSRTGSVVEADFLMVPAKDGALISRIRFDCASRTSQQRWNREVRDDGNLMPSVVATARPTPVPAGTLAGSLLERVCFNRKVKASAGWTQPTVVEAIRAARQVVLRIASTSR